MSDLVDQSTANPTRKVNAGAMAGALTAIVAWILGETTGFVVDPEVAIAISTVLSFVLSYFVSDREV